jgi:hypothetical protein
MRSFYSISLAGLFLVNTFAGLGILCLHQIKINAYIESIILEDGPGATLFKFTFDESTPLQWFDKGHEFKYKGIMYDVVRSEHNTSGRTTYYCISDKEESNIYNIFAGEFNPSSSNSNNDRALALQVFKIFSNLSLIHSLQSIPVLNEVHKCNINYKVSFQEVCLSVACEPPDAV